MDLGMITRRRQNAFRPCATIARGRARDGQHAVQSSAIDTPHARRVHRGIRRARCAVTAAETCPPRPLPMRLRRPARTSSGCGVSIGWRCRRTSRLTGASPRAFCKGGSSLRSACESWKRDPRVYLGFRPISSAIGRPGDALAKVDGIVQSLKAVPTRLENGARNLAVDIPRFRELGLFMAEGSLAVFDKEIPAFAEAVPTRKDELLQANARRARRGRRASSGS